MEKILSIIIPSYNMEKYLPKCLGSLIVDDAAVLQLLDVVVVNDGSKDRTSEIAHEFAAKYPGVVRVIDKPNGNYGSCINAALAMALGTFVKVLDADDSVDSEGLADFVRFLGAFDASQKIDVVFSDYVTVDEKGDVTATFTFPFPVDGDFGMDKIAESASSMAMHAVAYRTENLRTIGYRQSEGVSYTDTEWCFAPMSTVVAARYFNKAVYRYLVGREGQTVDPKVSARNVWMLRRVMLSLLETYRNRAPQVPAATTHYLQKYLSRIAGMLYPVMFFHGPIGEFVHHFSLLDRTVRKVVPSVYADCEEFVIFKSSAIPVPYVKLWRRSWPLRFVVYGLMRMLFAMRKTFLPTRLLRASPQNPSARGGRI